MIRDWCRRGFPRVPFASHLQHDRTKGAFRLAGLGLPEQTILLTRVADKLLSILQEAVPIAILHSVFSFGVDNREANLDGEQLIGADSAVEDFQPAFLRIENPRF